MIDLNGIVMPALVAGIHVLDRANSKTWMAGTSPAMTAVSTQPILRYDTAVVGSIVRLTSEILLAGKPLMSACLRTNAASFAR
jgi:hypothetical protein